MSADLLEQFLNYLAIEKGLRPRSLEAYRRDLQDWFDFAEARQRAVTSGSIDSTLSLFFVHMHDLGLSPRSMARKSSAIKGFYRFLLRENHISVDPTALLERPRIGRPLPKVLSQQEIEKILQQPDISTPYGLRDRAILEILYATGIRESELIDLKLGNLNAAAEFLSVTGKGGRERIVPIGQFAISAVNEYINKGRTKLIKDISERTLFLNPYGKSMSRMGVWKIIRKYALMAGICRDVSPHVFRHSCATHMLEGGAGIVAVQEMLGHVDVSTTQIYTHLTGKDLKKIHRKAHPRGQ
ncbi:MAG TPA: site-specific tyrosine recombinase XerD [Candidatus Riflebacteria bacterium]|jgi:integrase/recombinase XerD|nr:MAG: site-specific tyrosine recombinase XerD [Candidatus Riflebacteria bacterium HGW-Riflebacteria-1]HAE39793.1 site-specific tyrosine recombinase XerD [Candidatus Riflebacteria bacterium]